ncbi:MAG: c-type cytochrome [Helicobacteraceae bacterium]|jgi:ubiquinol-cytochrome c reductase cytochrome c1 subunit|nr:c-type cytochrome [Helicobacteraceae bacterium]
MKNLKIVAVLVGFVLVTYLGIEPYAHHVFNPTVAPPDFEFSDLYPALGREEVGAERNRVKGLIANADIAAGTETFMNNCAVCHSMEATGITVSAKDLIDGNGLLPPDLSNATSIYDEVFLVEVVKDPPNAVLIAGHTAHQNALLSQNAEALIDAHPNMTQEEAELTANDNTQKSIASYDDKIRSSYFKMPFLGLTEEETVNIVGFLKTQAKPIGDLDAKSVAANACARCHSFQYGQVELQANEGELKSYLGVDAPPPDLSVMIRSKGAEYLNTFINDPQKHLLGTAMPRVGLTQEAQEKVIEYIDQIGDPNKDERGRLGVIFVVYFLLLSVLAYMWKHNEFEEIGK